MLEIKKGIAKKPVTSALLIDFFKSEKLEGHLYIGYPILFAEDESITVDALWLSKKYGILIFDFVENEPEFSNLSERQNKIYGLIDSQLRAYPIFRKDRRNFLVNIEIVSFAPNFKDTEEEAYIFGNASDLAKFINCNLPSWKNPELFDDVLSVLQSVIHLKPKEKRVNVTKKDSRGAKLRELQKAISTLDRNQEKAVIEYFEGVQRIRGLAGSGKTIVLALKAAYLHTQNPDWEIAVTFNTRSLKEQFKDLINRFCVEKRREEPDWSKIKVVNAWGSPKDSENERGLYYDFCSSNGVEYYNFRQARKLVSVNQNPFEVICKMATAAVKEPVEKYDAILIDEAQDLSESFLKLCDMFLKSPIKRIVYAYDELQKLNEGAPLRNPKDFLINNKKKFDDQILKTCYRNPRPLLVAAHALGFGIYRKNEKGKGELVQFFDQPELWLDVGYEVESGELKTGKYVNLVRTGEYSPVYLENHSPLNDLIVFKSFKNKDLQARWVADEIERNLKEDELLYRDIIVINPIAITTKEEVALIRALLLKKEINNHIAGEFDADVFFKRESIAVTGINRAKGNEVPMVYIINAQDCYAGSYLTRDLIKRRNILFTAITRSKAWVRVVGYGKEMDSLAEEYEAIKSNNFKLYFRYPTEEEIEQLNIIHRDITDEERRQRDKEIKTMRQFSEIIKKIKQKEAYLSDYPDDVQKIIKQLWENSE